MNSVFKFLLGLLFFTNIAAYAQTEKQDLIGNWIATDHWNNESSLVLSEDNYVSMSINGEFIDGKNFSITGGTNNGKKGELKYSINTNVTPIEIDIIALLDNEEKGRILGAIKVIDKSEFLMTLSFNGVRDTNFEDSDNENIISVKKTD